MIQISLEKKLLSANGEMLLNVNFGITPGQLITLYGNSGAGKTSILRMIAGLMQPDRGYISVDEQVWFDSEKNISLPPQQRKIGFVFQDYALFPNMTVRENLIYALDKKQNRKEIEDLIDITGLGELQSRKPENLSGGQKQRVALARALVRKPGILMLDEPLSAIDVHMRSNLQDYILRVHKEFNLTTILVSHEPGEIIKMSDGMIVIEEGQIIKQGRPLEVFSNKKVSGKFQFSGEIIAIEKEDVVFIVTILIGMNIVRIAAVENEIANLNIGDKVMVASKAFNPLIQKIS